MTKTIEYSDSYDYKPFPFRPYRIPMVSIELFNGKTGRWRGLALLDTGADYSIFNTQIAQHLNIDFEKLPRIPVKGVGGIVTTYGLQKLAMKFGPIHTPIVSSVYFAKGQNPNLLGRISVLEHVQVGFDQAELKIYMKLNM